VVKKVLAPPPRANKAEVVDAAGKPAREAVDALLAKLFAQHPELQEEIGR
jgi:electron transfer flavoprotein beta subunit